MTTKTAPKPDTVALTVKVDQRTYVRLSTLRAKERKTVQDILVEAIKAYLSASGT